MDASEVNGSPLLDESSESEIENPNSESEIENPNSEIQKTASKLSAVSLNFEEFCRLPLYNWYRGIVILQACHSELQILSQRWDDYGHAAAVILTTLTGSAIFANMNDGNLSSSALQYIAGFIAFSSTCVQALLKSKKLESKAENHKTAHKILSKMRIRLEVIMGHVNDFKKNSITDSENHPWKKLYMNDDGKATICKEVRLWVNDYVEMQELTLNISQEKFDKQRKKYIEKQVYWDKEQGNVTGEST